MGSPRLIDVISHRVRLGYRLHTLYFSMTGQDSGGLAIGAWLSLLTSAT